MRSQKRREHRYIRRLETEFTIGERILRGISSNLSRRGLFIRTTKSLQIGSPLELTIHLPHGGVARAKGIVRRYIKTDSELVKNGMGIELVSYDDNYMSLVESISDANLDREYEKSHPTSSAQEPAQSTSKPVPDEYFIVSCPSCGVKNKVLHKKLSDGVVPRCGKCGSQLSGI